jgi:hypothetical protein
MPLEVHFVRITLGIQLEMKSLTKQKKNNYITGSMTDYKYSITRSEDVPKRHWKIKIQRRSSTTIHEER